MSLVWHVCVLITWMTCSQLIIFLSFFFFFNDTATTEIYTLSLHDALPISILRSGAIGAPGFARYVYWRNRDGYRPRSEEHTSELQSQSNLVCRLLLEKKKIPSGLPFNSRPLASAFSTG